MKILSIEASTHAASLALYLEGAVRQVDCPVGVSSSETLLPKLQHLLDEAGITLSQCDAIAFGAGPGAFTGLRVAVGITQGLAFAHDLPVISIETLAALAWSSGADSVLATLDARMGEIYAAYYLRQGDNLLRQGDIVLATPDAVPLLIDSLSGLLVVCGNAAAAYPTFAARLADRFCVVQPEALPQAAAIAQLGALAFVAGKAVSAEQALPLYVRDKVAMTVAERLMQGGKA